MCVCVCVCVCVLGGGWRRCGGAWRDKGDGGREEVMVLDIILDEEHLP